MKYKTFIFDLDGTLTDTLDDLRNSVNFALLQFGFPERSRDEIRSFVGNGVRKLIYRSVPQNTSDEIAEKCLEIFKEHYKNNSCVETKPYNGIIKLLEELKKRNIKTAVVTNKMHTAAADIVEHFFGGMIDVTVGQVDGVAPKPAPDSVFLALEKLGIALDSGNRKMLDRVIVIGIKELELIAKEKTFEPQNLKAFMRVLFNAGASVFYSIK